jgi:hypothetical protein
MLFPFALLFAPRWTWGKAADGWRRGRAKALLAREALALEKKAANGQ